MSRRTGWTHRIGATARDELRRMGEHLRVARERRGTSGAELAPRVGVDRRTVARLEAGDPATSVGVLLQALDVLGLARGIAEAIAPEHDHEAALREVRRLRRRGRGPRPIGDAEVEF